MIKFLKLSEAMSLLSEQINSYEFESAVEIITDGTYITNKNNSVSTKSGIYLIEIKIIENYSNFDEWLEEFIKVLNHDEYKNSHVPSMMITRCNFHKKIKLAEWFPLYIGKSKNISGRIKQHFELKLNQKTTGLKLMIRKEFDGKIFRVSTIVLDVISNYDVIAPQFEKQMRDKVNPILGRQ